MILLTAAAYVGWNAGANDTANCIGTTVGAGLLPFRRAVLIVAVFSILGALLQGQHVMKTIGRGIVHHELDFLAVCVALLSAGVFVSLATFKRIPTSTSQAIVGGLVGIGLVKGGRTISKKTIFIIMTGWVLTPCLAAATSFSIYKLLTALVS